MIAFVLSKEKREKKETQRKFNLSLRYFYWKHFQHKSQWTEKTTFGHRTQQRHGGKRWRMRELWTGKILWINMKWNSINSIIFLLLDILNFCCCDKNNDDRQQLWNDYRTDPTWAQRYFVGVVAHSHANKLEKERTRETKWIDVDYYVNIYADTEQLAANIICNFKMKRQRTKRASGWKCTQVKKIQH